MNESFKSKYIGFFIQDTFERIYGSSFNERDANVVLDHLLEVDLWMFPLKLRADVTRDDLIEGWLDFILLHLLNEEGCWDTKEF